MRDAVLCIFTSLGFIVSQIIVPEIAHTAIITVVNLDGAGEGFNDPSPPDSASASGGNSGATLGAQRIIAFQHAADIWANRLSSPVEIRIDANFDRVMTRSTWCSPSLTVAGIVSRVLLADYQNTSSLVILIMADAFVEEKTTEHLN